MKNYGIFISSEPYYGYAAFWVDYTNDNSEPSKEQIINCINKNIDFLSKFIKPSTLLDFSKALSDTLTGDELYSNLCANLLYINTLSEKAIGLSQELGIRFQDKTFGVSRPYDTEDHCHLMLFPERDEDCMSKLLRKPSEFKDWFDYVFADMDKDLFCVLIKGANPDDLIKADVCTKLDICLKSISYYQSEIKRKKEIMKKELNRLSDSMVLDENTDKTVKMARDCLNEKEDEKVSNPKL